MTDTTAATSGTIDLPGGPTVNRLGYGAMRITGRGIWGPPADHDESIRVLCRAVELGVQFIDTADSYGPDVSEELIAEALHPYPDDLVIATKGGLLRDGPGRWRPDGRPDHLRAACEGSLKRLNVERIDLYQLHTPDRAVPFEESLGALVSLKDEGKVNLIGLSNVTTAQLTKAMTITPIASVQNRFNATDRSSDDVLALVERHGLAFLPWAPVGGHEPGAGKALETVAKRIGASPVQVALAWQLARSPRMLPIPGTSSVAHVEENIAAAALKLSEADRAELG